MSIDIKLQSEFTFQVDNNFVQMSPLALNVLDEFIRERQRNLDRPFKYLEFGSGASTVYFVRNYPEIEVYSIEGEKEWYENVKTWCKPKVYEYHEATRFYTSKKDCNMDYITCMKKYGPFDLILNDGAQREMVADYILANPEKFISNGGMYLRHDYEKLIMGDWIGFHLPDLKETTEGFVVKHPEYTVMTINGNGKWGYKCELGGVWRRKKNEH